MELKKNSRRVLISSANPLFREGLRKMYAQHWGEDTEVIGTPGTLDETLRALDVFQPDLVIVDYDDQAINREEFLNRFVVGENPMKVILVSLVSSEPVVIYDRLRLTAAQADDWLTNPWKD